MKRQHRAELARVSLLTGQLFIKGGGARFEQARKEPEPMIELQAARDFRAGLPLSTAKGLGGLDRGVIEKAGVIDAQVTGGSNVARQ